jgi:Uma2 family endonuclease
MSLTKDMMNLIRPAKGFPSSENPTRMPQPWPLPVSAPARHLISVEAFHRMAETGILEPADRVEPIDGEIFDMSPIGVLHAAVVARLATYFSQKLGGAAVVWCRNPVRLDDASEPEPDIAILRPRADFYATSHPGPADLLLVIEVADTSLAFDLGTKVPLYARHGIPKVWVIDAATRRTRVFRRPAATGYAAETIVEPHEQLSGGGVIDEAGGPVVVELARLLPPVG